MYIASTASDDDESHSDSLCGVSQLSIEASSISPQPHLSQLSVDSDQSIGN